MPYRRRLGVVTLVSAVGWCDAAFAQATGLTDPSPVRMARVIFEPSEPDAVLESTPVDADPNTTWEIACEGPCDERLPAERQFRVVGPDYHPSRPFVLPGGRNRVVVNAEMDSTSIAFPRALCVIGGSMFLLGNALLALGNYQVQEQNDGEGLQTAGIVGLGGGALVGVTGVVVLLFQTRTKESLVRVGSTGGVPAGFARGGAAF